MAKRKSSPSDVPLYLFHEGSNARAYEYFGAHRIDGGKMVFRTWAPLTLRRQVHLPGLQ